MRVTVGVGLDATVAAAKVEIEADGRWCVSGER